MSFFGLNVNITGPFTNRVTNFTSFVSNADNLLEIPALDVGSATSTFTSDYNFLNNLSRIRMLNIGQSINVSNNFLDRDAIVEIFNNLQTTTGKTVTVTNNKGVVDLSAADIQIATDKGWTVTT